MKVLNHDNEENGVLCMKILTNFHRPFKNHIADLVNPFLTFVIDLYKNIPQLVKDTFSLNAVQSAGNTPITSFQSPRPLSPSIGSDFVTETSNKPLQKSISSFKVLTECPIIVVLLYSSHRDLVEKSLNQFIPLIIEVLKLQAPPQANAHAAAAARGEIYTSISPQIKNRAAYGEFITAQVKTMSFIAYALRHFADNLANYRQSIPNFVVRLLQDCPCELSPARKELLVATRHILSIDLRTAFIPKIDMLLDEKVLIGEGLTVRETLRPLAYSTIADLVHHVRAELSPQQIWKTVRVYCANVQDETLPHNVQIMSAKLLLNLVERIMGLPDKSEGRQLMVMILNSFVQRFTTLNQGYKHITRSHEKFLEKERKTQEELKTKYATNIDVKLDKPMTTQLMEHDKSTEEEKKDQDVEMKDVEEQSDEKKPPLDPEDLDLFEILKDKPIQIHAESTADELKDARSLFKNLMNFLKTVIYGLKSCNPPNPPDIPPQQWQESARVFNFQQISIFRSLFREGIAGHMFFASKSAQEFSKNTQMDVSSNASLGTVSKDEKELMETFATVFIHIDPATFNEVVEAELPFLYESLFSNPTLLHIPQFFLANESCSTNFAGILINFLREKLPELGSGDNVKANILIRLFKLCFMAVTLFPQTNEAILLPHLSYLTISCLELPTTAKDPMVYFQVLKALFRGIAGGKFELLYQEFLPLLQLLLASLNNLLSTARRPQERDIYVELCLTVPVRLSILVPHLSYLMRPLVIALNSSPELITQGLRTFELFVDNLTADYFDPILEPVVEDIMKALFKHLKPLPHNHQHSHTCLRILGKLGGRNRKYIQNPIDLENLSVLEQEVSVMLDFTGLNEKRPLKMTPAIQYALITLEDQKMDLHYRIQSFKYLSTALKLMIDTTSPGPDYAQKIKYCVDIMKSSDTFPELDDKKLGYNPRADTKARRLQNELFERLLQSVMFASSVPEIQEEAMTLLKEICEHCVLLELGDLMTQKRRSSFPLDITDHEGTPRLDPKSLLGAIIYALCHWIPEVTTTGQKAIHYVFDSGLALFESTDYVHRFPMFKTFFGQLSHTCFEEQYYRKDGACLGLKTIIKDLGLSMDWIKDRQLEFVRTMFFVLKDIPNDVPCKVRQEAKSLLLYVLEECNKGISEEQMNAKPYVQLTGLLAYELANANEIVRETSQAALAVLSKVTGKSISQIIRPVRNVLLPPIFTKPLRALPFPMQIGHIDAIKFCLGLPNTFLEFNEDLDRLMVEVLALAEADDASLASFKAKEHRTAEQMVQLRICCIKLLSLALTLPAYESIQAAPRRSQIMAVFFKTLYVRSSKVVDAAHAGLRAVVTYNNRLPKEILSNGLRPILVNLSDYKRLTVTGLEGLARLLEVLTNYFKVEIGNKLLDHLNAWAKPEVLHQSSNRPFVNDNNIKVIVAILNVFHLLPQGAFIFMNDLMKTVFSLESHLRRQHSSPFREPIAKYLNRYSSKALTFFLENFADRAYGRIFACFLEMPSAPNLRTQCIEGLDQIIKTWKEKTDPEEKIITTCNVIYILKALSRDDNIEWLKERKQLLTDVLTQLQELSPTIKHLPLLSPLPLQFNQALDDVQHIMGIYLSNTCDFDVLVQGVATIHTVGYHVTADVQNFIFKYMISSSDTEVRRRGLMKTLEAGTNKNNHLGARIFFFKNAINPTLVYEGRAKGNLDGLLEKATNSFSSQNNWIDQLHEKVWKNTTTESGEDGVGTIDYYRFELLNVSALLIKLGPNLISDVKKDIIKFGWSYIKLEDIVSKQAAYVLIAYFISAFETLSKMVVQIYVQLLKCSQNDAKYLVRQALDLLAPVLKERVTTPLWAKWPRRVLSEDWNNISQATNIYHFIVRHPKLFFDYRDHFVQTLISAMPKLSLIPNASSDNVLLSIDLADLILTWETIANENKSKSTSIDSSKKRKFSESESKEEKPKIETTGADTKSTTDTSSLSTSHTNTSSSAINEQPLQNYAISLAQRESCITFLVRFICANSQRITDIAIGNKVVGILYRLLGPDYWPEVVVKLSFFDKLLLSNELNSSSSPLILNALYVIAITIARKPSSWIFSNISHIQTLLQKPLKSNNIGILEAALNVIVIIFDAIKADYPNEEDDPQTVKDFLTSISNSIQENFTSNGSMASGIMMCWALVRFRPATVDPLLNMIMKCFSKLTRDHTMPNNQSQSSDTQSSENSTSYEPDVIVKLLLMVLDIGSVRISFLNDQRRPFLNFCAQLIDRSNDKTIGLRMIEIARNWVFSKTDHFPTTKEKAAILSKMIVYEIRGESELSKKFFEILIDIYTNPLTARTELSMRMEVSFMLGTKISDIELRQKLMKILNDSLDDSATKRLTYVISGQNWEYLADYQWINQALQILYGGLRPSSRLKLRDSDFTTSSLNLVLEALPGNYKPKDPDTKISPELEKFIEGRLNFVKSISNITAKDYFEPITELHYKCPELVHNMWVNIFPQVHSGIAKKDRIEFLRSMVMLLSKEYHSRQADKSPNVIMTLLDGTSHCEQLQLPPHLVKYLGKTFNAWYPAIQILEAASTRPLTESLKIAQSTSDALIEMYASLQEDDIFYGAWRRRSRYTETNTALSYEQVGLWSRATKMYENAQIKARSGALPYNESEYGLWEDHWILCAQKLQQWEVLTELAKHESFTDLLLECGWRVADWTADREPLEQSIKTVMDVPTPRRQIFETFLCLQGYANKTETLQNVYKQCDEGIQLALKKWSSLPTRITGAHIPLLHTFQQYVEFLEASQIYTTLHRTGVENFEAKSQELKGILKTWRERLPNLWDDIDLWGDLVTWRKHVFNTINSTYKQLFEQTNQTNNSNANSYAYRGYHELAWIINRFAHVARKHNMPDVCLLQLNKIYNLPNIEIQEAFLKLREQAKCYLPNPNEYQTGLDVISSTNLFYFSSSQKAEFFTLQGMFFSKLGADSEAEKSFSRAVQVDLYHPKAWAEWGYFNDRLYQSNPQVIKHAATALSCYLQAASLYKNGKTRKILSRILWLMSIEDDTREISSAFENYKGETTTWYWITFIPQLLTALSHKEAKFSHDILIQVARAYPQALHFHLRTAREDFNLIQRQALHAQQARGNANGDANKSGNASNANTPAADGSGNNNTANSTNGRSSSPAVNANGTTSQPWESAEEIMKILKTAYPLLSLSLEALVDQIFQRFKCLNEEDTYRLIMALLNESVQFMGRSQIQKDRVLSTEANIARFSETVLPEYAKAAFEKDFLKDKPEFDLYVSRLRKWRDRFEEMLDRRSGTMNLEALSPHLSEFHYQKFEDVEVPGQYAELKDGNQHFVKIDRFMPTVDLIRGFGQSYKRIKILGHNGSMHMFTVQYPSGRHCRREERVVQLFKILDGILTRKKESRRRNIKFTLPTAIPFSPHLRIIQDDPHYISMHAIYEDYCKRVGISRDEALDYATKKLRAALDPKLPKPDIASIRIEVLTAIQATIVPSTILRDYFARTYASFENFWLFRKQFSYQFACVTFMTYIMSINNRYPHKYFINTSSGSVWTTDMLPPLSSKNTPIFYNPEFVPFRLTPNIQTLMGPIALEGIFSVSVMVIAKCLTDATSELDQYMSIFIREELISWHVHQQRPTLPDAQLRDITIKNVAYIAKRATSLAQVGQGNIPANQTVIDLISQAVNPRNLALTDNLWMPYL